MPLTLKHLQETSLARCRDDFKHDGFSPSDWLIAVMEEVGEVARLLKRIRNGKFTQDEARQELADELADVQSYLVCLATSLNVDLESATIKKFNEVSDRVGSRHKL